MKDSAANMNVPRRVNSKSFLCSRNTRGGLAIGVVQDLHPILIGNGNDATEVISVKINVNKFEIRLVVGYGAQENDRQAKLHEMSQTDWKQLLWDFLEEEINEAGKLEQGLVIQIDVNAHLGTEIIKGDPNPRNRNGIIMAEFLERNPVVTVINSSELCNGLITRRRETIIGVQESVIDFFVVNERMKSHIHEMRVDEEEKFILTNFTQKNKNKKVNKSDHRPIILDLKIEYSKLKPDKVERFNFKIEACQKKLMKSQKKKLNWWNVLSLKFHWSQIKVWHKVLENIFYKSFKKIKVKNSNKKADSTESKLIDERKYLLRKLARQPTEDTSKRVAEIEDQLCDKNVKVITTHMKSQLNQASENDSTNGTRTT